MKVMSAPILVKIDIEPGNLFREIPQILSSLGKAPIIINLDEFPLSEIQEFLEKVEPLIISSGINPKFPYPVYIFTIFQNIETCLPLIHSEVTIPKHLRKSLDARKIGAKERAPLHSLEIKTNRLLNTDINSALHEIDKLETLQRELISQSKEVDFCKKVRLLLSREEE